MFSFFVAHEEQRTSYGNLEIIMPILLRPFCGTVRLPETE
jgi:hypothetical protein